LSVTPDDTRTETIIESIEDKLERIWYYDASIDKWYFYNPDPIFSSANNLLTLEPGKGYQFNMKQAATLKVIGMPYEFQPITLEANKWYMIGTFFSDVTLSNILGNCSLEKIEISTMDEEGNNVPIAKSSSTLLESKKGYNIKSTNDCELGKILDVSDTVTTSTTPSQCGQQCGSTTCQSYETCITEYPDDEGIDAYETNTCILSSECGATCNEWVQKYSNILNIGIQDEPCSEFANCAGIERDDFNVEVPCEDGYLCVGKCTVPEPSVASVSLIVENRKLESKYSNKEVFLISDTDWEDVLSLVPITTWTENAQIIKYPTLIYHEEDDAFDADSIIYFIQQYSPSRVTIIGQTPQELDNLLIAPPELGAGLSNNQIQRISINDYFSYWTSFGKVVYVENNYELALLASTYASLINAPLIIQGTNYDSQNVFSNRKIICVGNVNPTGSSCNEQYNLEQLQRKYVDETGTDKIMLVNPNDLDIKVINDVESFFSKDFTKSSGIINEIYSGTSLAAPILASAKQELILTINSPNYEFVDQKLKSSITNYHIVPNYLTIFATPDAVQQTQIGLKYLEEWVNEDDRVEVDNHIYGDLDGDFFQELAVGRIYGITISDVSSYVGRDLFYDELPHSNDFAVLWAPDFPNMISAGKTIDKLLSATGMNERSVYATNDGGPKMFNPKNDFENKALIAYLDHGSWNGGSLGYTTPDLANNDVHFDSTVVISNACSVNAYDKITEDSPKHMFFGGQLIRRGALAHFAAVEDAGLNADLAKTVVEQIAQGYNNGMALRNVRNLIVPEPIFEFDPFYVLLGDPTFNLNLNRPTNLEEIKIETDTDSKIIKILWPSISAGIKFDFGNKNVKKSEGELFFNHFSTNLLRDYYLKDYRYYENGELKHSEEVFQASTTLVTPLDMAINSINEIEIRSLSFNKLLKCANNPWGSVVCVEDPDNLIAREESVYPLLTRDNKGNDWLYVSILLNGEDIVDKDVLEAREYYLYYD
jgi:hypothetical protein